MVQLTSPMLLQIIKAWSGVIAMPKIIGERNKTASFSLGLYVLIVFALSWPFQIISNIWGTNLLLRYVLNSASMIMVTIGTYVAGRYVFRDNFIHAGWRWGKAKDYFTVIAFALILWVVPTLVGFALKTKDLPAGLPCRTIIWVFILLFVTLIPGFGEEFGWRGYLLPHLASGLSARRSVILHAVIWWIWHLPVLAGTILKTNIAGAEKTYMIVISVLSLIILGAVPIIMHGVIFAYFWSKSRSLAVATVYHAVYDGMRDSLGITVGISSMAGLWANLVITVWGAFLLWKGDWSNLKEMITSRGSVVDERSRSGCDAGVTGTHVRISDTVS